MCSLFPMSPRILFFCLNLREKKYNTNKTDRYTHTHTKRKLLSTQYFPFRDTTFALWLWIFNLRTKSLRAIICDIYVLLGLLLLLLLLLLPACSHSFASSFSSWYCFLIFSLKLFLCTLDLDSFKAILPIEVNVLRACVHMNEFEGERERKSETDTTN